MKKLLVVLAVVIISKFGFAEPPSAGWNFGNVTYGQVDGSLVLNSLSDRYGISTFQTATQSLGTNDYIEENGVKNTLALDGYTKAYDYNPNSQTGYGYSSVYNQSLPNVPLTKLTFMGLDGDPTKAQDVYVLTSEYNALSAQGQASSISILNSSVSNLQNQSSVANTNVTNLQSSLNTTNVQVNSNAVAINNETVRAVTAENTIVTNLNATNSQVNVNTQNISTLATGLGTETSARIAGNVALQSQVNATNDRVSALSSRVDKLEQVKVMADLNVRILDTKKYAVGFFDMWDGTNNRNFAFGARLTYKLGKSYEEKVLEKQLKQIQDLQAALSHIQDQLK